MTRFIFVRHGESEANLLGVFAGHYDAPLTKRGVRQAELTAAFLRDTPIDAAYASDLRRAFVTGECIAAPHALSVQPDRQLREIDGGAWEGVPFSALAPRWAAEYDAWMHHLDTARCPGGESVGELQDRVNAELERIAAMNEGRTVLIATHATPIRVMELLMRGWPLGRIGEVPWVPNASVTIADYDAGAWRVILRGAAGHLGALETMLPTNI